MKPTAEQRMDQAIFSERYDKQLADIRRFRLNMLGDAYPKPVGFWAKLKAILKGWRK